MNSVDKKNVDSKSYFEKFYVYSAFNDNLGIVQRQNSMILLHVELGQRLRV